MHPACAFLSLLALVSSPSIVTASINGHPQAKRSPSTLVEPNVDLDRRHNQKRQRFTVDTGIPVSLTAISTDATVLFNNQALSAIRGRFMVGPATDSGCPPALPRCAKARKTILNIHTDGTAYMAIKVPGRQAVLIALNPRIPNEYGNLTFTATSAGRPPLFAGSNTPFSFIPGGGVVGTSNSSASASLLSSSQQYPVGTEGAFAYNNHATWIACPAPWLVAIAAPIKVPPDMWAVYAKTKRFKLNPLNESCKEFTIKATVEAHMPAAWNYAKLVKPWRKARRVSGRKERGRVTGLH